MALMFLSKAPSDQAEGCGRKAATYYYTQVNNKCNREPDPFPDTRSHQEEDGCDGKTKNSSQGQEGGHTGTSYRLPEGQSNWQRTGRRPEKKQNKRSQ